MLQYFYTYCDCHPCILSRTEVNRKNWSRIEKIIRSVFFLKSHYPTKIVNKKKFWDMWVQPLYRQASSESSKDDSSLCNQGAQVGGGCVCTATIPIVKFDVLHPRSIRVEECTPNSSKGNFAKRNTAVYVLPTCVAVGLTYVNPAQKPVHAQVHMRATCI